MTIENNFYFNPSNVDDHPIGSGGLRQTDQRVNFLYAPSNYASGGSGDLYVVEPAGSTVGETTNQWILGKIAGTDGKQTGNIISPVRPADLVAIAFSVK